MSIDDTIQKLLKKSKVEEKKKALERGEDMDNISNVSSKVYEEDNKEEGDYVEMVRRAFFAEDYESLNRKRKEDRVKKLKGKDPEEEEREILLSYLCNMPPPTYKFPFYHDVQTQNTVPPEYFQLSITGHSV